MALDSCPAPPFYPLLSASQLLVTSIVRKSPDNNYRHTLAGFNTSDPKDLTLGPEHGVVTLDQKPDLAAAVTISRDDQHIFVYVPETAVRDDVGRT